MIVQRLEIVLKTILNVRSAYEYRKELDALSFLMFDLRIKIILINILSVLINRQCALKINR